MTTETIMPTGNAIRTTTSKDEITLDNIHVNDFQKAGTKTAQLRQRIVTTSYYPSKKVDSNLQQNPFAASDFGFAEQVFESIEERMAWLLIPENSTEDALKVKLAVANKNGATIYKVLSNSPILDENQAYAVKQGIRTKDQFAVKQLTRYPKNAKNDEAGLTGKLILDKAGNVQYRRTYLWLTPMTDKDVRGSVDFPVYVPKEIEAELKGASVFQGQTL